MHIHGNRTYIQGYIKFISTATELTSNCYKIFKFLFKFSENFY